MSEIEKALANKLLEPLADDHLALLTKLDVVIENTYRDIMNPYTSHFVREIRIGDLNKLAEIRDELIRHDEIAITNRAALHRRLEKIFEMDQHVTSTRKLPLL